MSISPTISRTPSFSDLPSSSSSSKMSSLILDFMEPKRKGSTDSNASNQSTGSNFSITRHSMDSNSALGHLKDTSNSPSSPKAKEINVNVLWNRALDQICDFYETVFDGFKGIDWEGKKTKITFEGARYWTITAEWLEGKGKAVTCSFRGIKPLGDKKDEISPEAREVIACILGCGLATHLLDNDFKKIEMKLIGCGVKEIIKNEQKLLLEDHTLKCRSEVSEMIAAYTESRRALPVTRAIQRSFASIMAFIAKYPNDFSKWSHLRNRKILKGIDRKLFIEEGEGYVTKPISISGKPKLRGKKLQAKDLERCSIIEISDLIVHVFFKILEEAHKVNADKAISIAPDLGPHVHQDLARAWLKAASVISVKEETLNEFAKDTVTEGLNINPLLAIIISETWKNVGVEPKESEHFSKEDLEFLKQCRLGIESTREVEKQIKSISPSIKASPLNISPQLSNDPITSVSDYEDFLMRNIRVYFSSRLKASYEDNSSNKQATKIKDIAQLVEQEFRIIDYHPNADGSYLSPNLYSMDSNKLYKDLKQFPETAIKAQHFTLVPSARVRDLDCFSGRLDEPFEELREVDDLVTAMATCVLKRVITVVQKRPKAWLASAKQDKHESKEKN